MVGHFFAVFSSQQSQVVRLNRMQVSFSVMEVLPIKADNTLTGRDSPARYWADSWTSLNDLQAKGGVAGKAGAQP